MSYLDMEYKSEIIESKLRTIEENSTDRLFEISSDGYTSNEMRKLICRISNLPEEQNFELIVMPAIIRLVSLVQLTNSSIWKYLNPSALSTIIQAISISEVRSHALVLLCYIVKEWMTNQIDFLYDTINNSNFWEYLQNCISDEDYDSSHALRLAGASLAVGPEYAINLFNAGFIDIVVNRISHNPDEEKARIFCLMKFSERIENSRFSELVITAFLNSLSKGESVRNSLIGIIQLIKCHSLPISAPIVEAGIYFLGDSDGDARHSAAELLKLVAQNIPSSAFAELHFYERVAPILSLDSNLAPDLIDIFVLLLSSNGSQAVYNMIEFDWETFSALSFDSKCALPKFINSFSAKLNTEVASLLMKKPSFNALMNDLIETENHDLVESCAKVFLFFKKVNQEFSIDTAVLRSIVETDPESYPIAVECLATLG